MNSRFNIFWVTVFIKSSSLAKFFLQQAFPLKFLGPIASKTVLHILASVLKFLSSAMKNFPCSIYLLHLSTKKQYEPAYSQLFLYFPSCLQHLPCCPKCRSAAFWRQLLRLQQDLDRFLKKKKGKLLIGNTEGFGNGLSLSLRLSK